MIDPQEFGKAMGGLIREAVAPLLKRIEELESRQLERGEKGEQGDPGQDAQPVEVSAVVAELLVAEELKTLVDLQVAEAVAEYFEANPVQHGKDGAPGVKGDPGDRGEPGRDGADGLDVKELLRADGGRLMAVMSDGTTKDLGQFVGKDGQPGKDGADGLGFDDADIAYDGERSFTITWRQGDRVKEKTFHVPTVIDRGYWREGTEAKTGDAMTHDGTLWIAVRDTKAKPARESEDWRIGARRGRDGIQGPAGKDYKPPEPVKLS